jgi:hypothetical protein
MCPIYPQVLQTYVTKKTLWNKSHLMTREKALDWKKIILIKNIKYIRAMLWFLHASISIQVISIYHN